MAYIGERVSDGGKSRKGQGGELLYISRVEGNIWGVEGQGISWGTTGLENVRQ
jgi:hypothetical protein